MGLINYMKIRCRWSSWCSLSYGSSTATPRSPSSQASLHTVVFPSALSDRQAPACGIQSAKCISCTSKASPSAGPRCARATATNTKCSSHHCSWQARAGQSRTSEEADSNNQLYCYIRGQRVHGEAAGGVWCSQLLEATSRPLHKSPENIRLRGVRDSRKHDHRATGTLQLHPGCLLRPLPVIASCWTAPLPAQMDPMVHQSPTERACSHQVFDLAACISCGACLASRFSPGLHMPCLHLLWHALLTDTILWRATRPASKPEL